jgi:hypothetical protein
MRCKLPLLFGVKLVKVICCINLHNHIYGHKFSKFRTSQIKDKTLIELIFIWKEHNLHLQHLRRFKKLVVTLRTNLEKCPLIKNHILTYVCVCVCVCVHAHVLHFKMNMMMGNI